MEKEKLIELAKNIYVLKPFKDPVKDTLRYAVYPKVDPVTQSCIWESPVKDMEAINVQLIAEDIQGEHTYGHPSLFKPSLLEILEAVPENLIGTFNAVSVKYNGFIRNKHSSIIQLYKVDINLLK